MSKRKPKPKPSRKARSVEIDWLIGRVLETAHDVVLRAAQFLRETEAHRQQACALLVDGMDPIALAFYDDCRRGGMHGPPQLKPHMVTTLTAQFEPLLQVAGLHYATAQHVEAPLRPGEVRAVVLTLGTLTVVRLGPDTKPRHASRSYRPLRADVLLVAVACWRNDMPEGLHLKAVFKTRQQGERFLAHYLEQLGQITASRPQREAIEEQLRRFKPLYWGSELPIEVEARTYAQVGWLEDAGLVPDDSFNGLVFTYGCEMDLYGATELVRQLGGSADDLS